MIRPFPNKHINVLIILFLFTAASFLVFAISIFDNNPNGLLCGPAFCALLVLIIPQLKAKNYDLFQPLNFVILTTLFGVVLRTFYIVFAENENTRSFLLLGKHPMILFNSSILIVFALLFMIAGYLARVPQINLSRFAIIRKSEWNSRRFIFVVVILILISVSTIILYIQKLGLLNILSDKLSIKRSLIVQGARYEYAALGYYLWGASLISYVFYLLLALLAYSGRKLFSPIGILVLLVGALAAIFPVITSSRGEVLFHFVYAALIWHYLRGSISIRKLIPIITLTIGIFVLLAALRAVGQGGKYTVLRDYLQIEKIIEVTVGNRNWLGVAKTAHILDAVPEKLDYQYGKTLLTWIVAPMPRTLWKEKPIIRAGPILGRQIFMRKVDRTGVPPGYIGELYWNFGIIAIPLGMFLLGYWLKFLYFNFVKIITNNKNALLIYVFLMVPFSLNLLGGDLTGVIIKVVTSLLTLIVLLKFISFDGSSPNTGGNHHI
ncbi:MAG: O-antigen polymerase [bacterium]